MQDYCCYQLSPVISNQMDHVSISIPHSLILNLVSFWCTRDERQVDLLVKNVWKRTYHLRGELLPSLFCLCPREILYHAIKSRICSHETEGGNGQESEAATPLKIAYVTMSQATLYQLTYTHQIETKVPHHSKLQLLLSCLSNVLADFVVVLFVAISFFCDSVMV